MLPINRSRIGLAYRVLQFQKGLKLKRFLKESLTNF